MSLIEVVLAMAILGGALAILGEIIQLADRNAADAQALQNAQLHAESVIDELQSGARALTDVAEEPLDAEARPPWLLTLTLGTSNIAGVAPVEIEVRQDLPENLRPVRYRLTRWFSTLSATAADAGAEAGAQSGASQRNDAAASGGAR